MVTMLKEAFPQYEIGRGSYGNNLSVVTWGEGAKLKIGAFCSFADNVKILLGGEHRTDWVTTYPFSVLWQGVNIPGHPKTKGDVLIGNDVWIGTESLILSGVTIGDGAVIGARSVVSKNVAPYAIMAGNRAKFIRYRFDAKKVRDALLRLKWWNWEDEKIRERMHLLLDGDVENLLEVEAHLRGSGSSGSP
jgi:acetyltransferase-like isoleucine patch superfamily enzyme